jgi:hypothetical protein
MQDSDIPFAFNRKEAKDHGEGGNLVGAPLKGNVLMRILNKLFLIIKHLLFPC